MASEAVVRFLDALETDSALQQEVEATVAGGTERLDAAVTVARAHGYEFTTDDLKGAMEARTAGRAEELSEAELEGVSGGAFIIWGRDKKRSDTRY